VILKYTVMSHCGGKCSSLLRGLYSVQLYKITYCTELQRKFVFRFNVTSKYTFLKLKRNAYRKIPANSEKNYT